MRMSSMSSLLSSVVVLDVKGCRQCVTQTERDWYCRRRDRAYDLIATDDEQLTNAARRYFKSQPVATASMILVTGLHLVGGIPSWCDPITLSFAAYRQLLNQRSPLRATRSPH